MIILQYLFCVYIISSVVTILCNYSNYKWYKPTYEALYNRDYIWIREKKAEPATNGFSGQVYFHTDANTGGISFISKNKSGSITLINGETLIGGWTDIFDPYTLYWMIKLNRWFKRYGGRVLDVSYTREQQLDKLL